MSETKVLPWLRLYTEIIDDWKIRSIAFEDRWHYVAILCLKRAGELDREEINLRMMSVKLGVTGQDLEGIQKRLIEAELIDENWQPLAWYKRQQESDRDSTNAERQKRYRAKKKEESQIKTEGCDPVTESNALRNVTVTPLERDKELDRDKDLEDKNYVANATTSDKSDCCPHQKIIDLYHEILPDLPSVREWTPERQKLLRSRWREKPERQNLDWWREYFQDIAQSDFLLGRSGDRAWRASLEWLIRPRNLPRVVEGNYKNRGSPSQVYSNVTAKNLQNMAEFWDG